MSTKIQDDAFAVLMNDHVEVTTSLDSTVLDFAIDFIQSEFEPDDVFSTTQLEKWAESNGYIKE